MGDAGIDGDITRDFEFGVATRGMGMENVSPPKLGPSWSNISRLDQFAAVYHHTSQAFDFWTGDLGQTLDHSLPEDIIVDESGSSAYHENFWSGNHDIHIPDGRIPYNHVNRPTNREWHEFAHHAQADIWEDVGAASPWPWHQNPSGAYIDGNHSGWNNHCTSDSLIEGLAEFFPSVMKTRGYATDASNGETRSWIYECVGGHFDLELNEDYVRNRGTVQEEIVVARILWDVYDGAATYPSGPDDETAAVSLPVWWVLAPYRENLHDVYDALIALPDATIMDAQVNSIFLSHGAYADLDGDLTRDATEPIGQLAEASRPTREEPPPQPGTAIALDAKTTSGADVTSLRAVVDVDYESAAARDFSYQIPIQTTGATAGAGDETPVAGEVGTAAGPLIYLAMPSTATAAEVTIRVRNTDNTTATQVATFSSSGFWAAHETWSHRIDSASNDVIATRSFTVPKAGSRLTVGGASPEFTTGPASSGIAYVTYGGSLTVLGELDPAHPGARVKTYFRPSGSRRWSYLGSVGVVGGTVYGKTFRPTKNGTFKVYYAGDTDHGASSRTASVRVRHKVKWFSSASSVARNARFTFRGSVSPTHRGRRVALQRLSTPGGWSTTAGTWKTVAYATINRYGRFSGAWRPTSYGTYRLRVVLSSDGAHSFGESVRRWLQVK